MPPRKKTEAPADEVVETPEAPSPKESPVDHYEENGDVFMDPKVADASRHNYKVDPKTRKPVEG